MNRILYIDVPFANETGGDKNRSRFLWNALQNNFDADCLLIGKDLATTRGPFYQSESVFAFDAEAREQFNRQLAERKYNAVVTRFHSPWELAKLAQAHPTKPAVVVDLDMISSRLVALAWRAKPTMQNRWFLFEKLKLERQERQLYRQPWLIFFSNPVEMAGACSGHVPAAKFALLPNVMPASPKPCPVIAPKPVVLFFGSMNSAANLDGFRFLADEILPLLEGDLRKHGVKIRVAGKGAPSWFKERAGDCVEIVGPVDSMERAILESQFILLPLRIASGTRTRILEAAALGKAIVTTTIGAEGIEVGDDALVRDDPAALAAAVRQLLEQPTLAAEMGQRLQARCAARYASDKVAADFTSEINRFIAGGAR